MLNAYKIRQGAWAFLHRSNTELRSVRGSAHRVLKRNRAREIHFQTGFVQYILCFMDQTIVKYIDPNSEIPLNDSRPCFCCVYTWTIVWSCSQGYSAILKAKTGSWPILRLIAMNSRLEKANSTHRLACLCIFYSTVVEFEEFTQLLQNNSTLHVTKEEAQEVHNNLNHIPGWISPHHSILHGRSSRISTATKSREQ